MSGDYGEVTAEYLERLQVGKFKPDEPLSMLFNVSMQLQDALSEEASIAWKLTPDYALDALEHWDTGERAQEFLRRNQDWLAAERNREWWRTPIEMVRQMAIKHGLDPSPALWFGRFLGGGPPLSDADQRQLRDLIERLVYIERGVDSSPIDAARLSTELSVPKRPLASPPELFPQGPPENKELAECILMLVAQRDGIKSDYDILAPRFRGEEPLIVEMQNEIRRTRDEGIHTLPVNPKRRKRTP